MGSDKRTCVCGKALRPHENTCSWTCTVAVAKAAGGRVHTPNGLPIKCVRHDGTMLEHEDGDHPDYRFPVDVEYVGEVKDEHRRDYEAVAGVRPASDADVRDMYGETHALIYTDGCVAVTLYETCYAMWLVRSGEPLGGRFTYGRRLTEAARKQIAGLRS